VTSESTTITQYRCEKCNAPYPLGADDVIATCPYCGYTFTVGGKEIPHLILPNKLDKNTIKTAVMKWLEFAAKKTVGSGIIGDIELEEPRLQWIPTFRIEGEYKSYHFGYKTEGSGNSRKYRRFETHNSGHAIEWVIARRHAATFGIDELLASLEDTKTRDFEIGLTNDAPVLNSEISDEDAIKRGQRNKKDRERTELLKKMDKLLDHSLDINPESSVYTHAPYWLVRYSYQKGTFRIAVSGAKGEVLLGELPVTKRYRTKRWLVSIFLLISASALFQILPYILILFTHANSNAGDLWAIPIVILLLACVLWIGSIVTVGGALKYEVQVNKKGEERKDEFTLDGTIRRLGGKVR
jgi:DNA-directed RNA polymerase subunit RPC12/RpoP